MAFDEGCVAIKIGREEPVASMDASGKVIWARHNDIQTVNIKSLGPDQEATPPPPPRPLGRLERSRVELLHLGGARNALQSQRAAAPRRSCAAGLQADGERLPLAIKDLGSCDLYPQSLQHNPNGRFVTVCGEGEYIVYTALAWRNKSFGSALDSVWADDSSTFAIRCCPAS